MRSTSGVLTSMSQDLRLGLRALRSTPRITAVAILSLALGSGATTAFFSILNGLLLRTLPVSEPERLGVISTATDASRGQTPGWTAFTWRELQRRQGLFDSLAAFTGVRLPTATTGEPEPADVLMVSGDFFRTVGVRSAFAGRLLAPSDDVVGGGQDGAVAVVSYTYWQSHLGASATVIGRRFTLGGVPFTIVGITPPPFRGVETGRAFDVAVPLAAEPMIRGRDTLSNSPVDRWLTVLVRLKPGQSLESATSALRAAQAQIREAALPPAAFARIRQGFLKEPFTVLEGGHGTSGLRLRARYTRPLVMLLVVGGLVLLIACVNVANLQLARSADRSHEFSVRVALGSSRWRLLRQLLVESAVLAAAGGVLGAVLGAWAGGAVVAQLSSGVSPLNLDVSIDTRVFLFVFLLTAAITLLFGTVPAIRASQVTPVDALRLRQSGANAGPSGVLSGWLIVAQVALCVVLVTGACLFMRTLDRLIAIPLGFDMDRVLVVDVNVARVGVPPLQRPELIKRLLSSVAAVPGVEHPAAALITPVAAGFFPLAIDRPGGGQAARPVVGTFVTPEWFASYGIAVKGGRDLDAFDTSGSPLVVVVNESFARTVFPRGTAIGQVVGITGAGGDIKLGRRTIVGIVGDSLTGSLRDGVKPALYMSLSQWNAPVPVPAALSISVRPSSPLLERSQLMQDVTAAIRAVNPSIDLRVRQITEELRASMAQERLVALLSGFFGLVALLLAALGLYGVTAHGVARRRTELGIRLALGAPAGTIVTLVVRQLLMFVGVGVLTGVAGGYVLSQFVSGLLYGVEARDTTIFALSAVAVAAMAAAAAAVPALRSARADPMQVLRVS
jgi:predicted permease